MQKKKALIFDAFLAPYRMDTFNALSEILELHVLLLGLKRARAWLGYDLDAVNQQAKFPYQYYSKGIKLFGRHLISFIYFRWIKKVKPDIVIASELGANTIFAIFLKPFYKYKLFVMTDDSPKMAMSYGFFRNLLRRFVVGHSHGLIVVHPQVKDFLSQKYKKYSCQYYYLPIIHNEETIINQLKNAFETSERLFVQYSLIHKKVILFVGRLEKEKALDLLLTVFSELYAANNDLRLIFVGNGSMEHQLKEYAVRHHLNDAVLFAGRLTGEQLYAWYNIGQILVLPSVHEPFGAVVNEALASGCQAVVSDSVGAACLINEMNGVIFKTNDHADLKNALFQTLEKVEPLAKVEIKNNTMEESFSKIMDNFVDFICNDRK